MPNLQKSHQAGERPVIRLGHIIAFILISIALVLIQPHYEQFMAWLLSDFDPHLLAAALPITPRISLKRFGRIFLINEIRDTLNALFPSPRIAEKLGRNASLTGAVALLSIICTIASVVLSYPAIDTYLSNPDFAIDRHTLYSWTASIAIASAMFVFINLFWANISEFIFSWGNPSAVAIVAAALIIGSLGYFDYNRMVDGSEVYAERLAGGSKSTVLAFDPTSANMLENYYLEIAEKQQVISWCGTKGHGKAIIEATQHGQQKNVRCKHNGCTQMRFATAGQSATARKAHKRIAALREAAQQIVSHHHESSESYKQLVEKENQARDAKEAKYKGLGKAISTYLYAFMFLLSAIGNIVYVQAAKKAGLVQDEIREGQSPGLNEADKESIFQRLRSILDSQADPITAQNDNSIGFKQSPKNETPPAGNNSPNSENFRERPTPYNLGKQYDTKASRKAAKKLRTIYAQTNEIPSANALAKKAKVSWATAKNVLTDFQA